MHPKKLKISLSVTFHLLCILGFIFQAREIFQMYFTYLTSTLISIEPPDEEVTPSTSICIRYVDILNRTQMDEDKVSPTLIVNSISRLVIKDIFKYTPSSNDTLDTCSFRPSIGRHMEENLNSSICNSIFKVDKYYTQEFICYQYTLTISKTYTLRWVAHSDMYSFQVYRLHIRLPGSSLVLSVLSNEHPFPLYSKTFGTIRWIKVSDTTFRGINLNYQRKEVQLLEPPYDTNCHPSQGIAECIRSCHIEGFKSLRLFPSSEITDEPLNIRHSIPDDNRNESYYRFADQVYLDCRSRCRRQKCRTTIFFTKATTFDQGKSSLNWTFPVLVFGADTNAIIVISTPKVYFLDFLIYICSSIGLWFGISVASLNPAKWINGQESDIKRQLDAVKEEVRQKNRRLMIKRRMTVM